MNKVNRIITLFLIFVFAVTPAYYMNERGQNTFLLGVMALSPILLIINIFSISKFDIPIIIMCSLMILFPLTFHPETMRWSTLIYTGMYCCSFIAFVRVLYKSNLKAESFLKLLRYIMYAHAIVLLIQQFCFFSGLPIINRGNIDLNGSFPRLNSLGPEPSWTARNVCMMMYIFICIWFKKYGSISLWSFFKNNKWMCASFLWVIVTCGSATGFIFFPLILLRFLSLRNIVFLFLICFACIVTVSKFTEITSLDRVSRIVPAVVTFDETEIIAADPSGSVRIVPTLKAAQMVSLSTFEGWFGHGIDYDTNTIKFPGMKVTGGGFALWLNYGFIVMLLFWGITFSICRIKGEAVSILFWFFIVFWDCTINIQMLWFLLMLFITYKYIVSHDLENRSIGKIRKKIVLPTSSPAN